MHLCTYCGDLANTRDHIIPVSYTHGYRVFLGTTWVWCCRECNTLLSNKMLGGIDGKAAYLYETLLRRHKDKTLTPRLIDRLSHLADVARRFERTLPEPMWSPASVPAPTPAPAPPRRWTVEELAVWHSLPCVLAPRVKAPTTDMVKAGARQAP